MTTSLEAIDPALRLMSEFARLGSSTTQAIQSMRQKAIFTDGLLPARHKALAAVLWAVSARCEPCIRFYVQEAKRLGATKEETAELLAVASAMGGCVGEMWALKAFHAYVHGSQSEAGPPSCCSA